LKQFKTLVALVLAIALTMTLVGAAMAETITVTRHSSYDANNENPSNRTLKYFKVFDATKDGEAISYTLAADDPWVAVLTATSGEPAAPVQTYFTLTPNASNTLYYVTAGAALPNDTAAKDAADWLYTNKPSTVTETAMTYDGSVEGQEKWTADIGSAIGYYVIVSYDPTSPNPTKATNLIAATTNISVTEKNEYPTVDKKQKDSTTAEYGNDNVSVKVGDTIYYSVDVTIPDDASLDTIVTDTMTRGLTYNADSMMIKVGDGAAAATNAHVTAVAKQDGDTFTWKYTIDHSSDVLGKHVIFTFTATVNSDAIIDTGKENEVDLQYGNTDYHHTDRVDYDIFATGALKYDGATGVVDPDTNVLSAASGKNLKPLDGAHFKLQVQAGKSGNWADLAVAYDSTNNYYYPTTGTGIDIVTPENGEVYIRGLDDDNNYRLVETQAPQGYNLMNPAETSNMTLVADTYTGTTPTLSTVNELAKLKIANHQGSELPSTGGIGTTIFYVAGIVLVLGAAAIIIARRKAEQN